MKYAQFEQWLKYHIASFPGMTGFLSKLKGADDPNRGEWEPTREDVIGAFYRALRDTELDDAKRATDRMKAGDEEEPRGFDRHPTEIAKIAARHRRSTENRPVYIDGQRTVGCKHCGDTGSVMVWSWKAARAARNGEPIPIDRSGTVTLRCPCEAGEHYRNSEGFGVFDPEKHMPITPCLQEDADEQDKLRESVARCKPENHESAFDQFG